MRTIVILAVLLSIISCKKPNRPVSFIYLDKLSGKDTASFGENGYIYKYLETILIDNEPNDRVDKFKLLRKYFNDHNKISLLEEDITRYSMMFWVKNSCTEYFIDNYLESGGFSSNNIFDDCENDLTGLYYYKRDKKNTNLWISKLPKGLNDTIYCNPNRKTVKLPNIKYNE